MDGNVKSPMVKVVIPLMLGIILFMHVGSWPGAGLYCVSIFVLVVILRYTPLNASWRFRWIPGVALLVALVSGGYRYAETRNTISHARQAGRQIHGKGPSIWMVRVEGTPEKTKNAYRAVVKVLYHLDSCRQPERFGFPCLAYFRADSLHALPSRGDSLIVYTSLELIAPPSNPGEFDFRKYMSGRNIAFRAFIRAGEWRVTGHRKRWLMDLADRFRDLILRRLHLAGLEGQELALASSLLLGEKDGLDKDLRESFSAAGAMHVLCVSGLHVGIIFLLINGLLRFLNRWKYGVMVRFAAVLSCIWLYALITGLSPSVTRASLMFSLLQSGKLMKNPPPTVNSLAASALLILWIDPLVISNVGFQFSYLAVLAILFIAPLFQSLWAPRYSLVARLWSLAAVSIAAQAGTGPLALHYFHQFPVWFLLTNMMVIPLATLILYLSMFVIFSPAPALAELAGKALSLSIRWLSASVQHIEDMPWAVIREVPMPLLNTLLAYGVIVLIYLLFTRRSKMVLIIMICTLIASSVNQGISKWDTLNQKELYIYQLKGGPVMDYFSGRTCYSVLDTLAVTEEALEYHVRPNRMLHNIDHLETLHFHDERFFTTDHFWYRGDFLDLGGLRVYLATGDFIPGVRSVCEADLLILTGSFHGKLEDLIGCFPCEQVVVDASVPPWEARNYETLCKERGMKCFSIPREGCFAIKSW